MTDSTEHRPLAVLGWGAFLACSWTWCIGMFLPAILLRDYGTFSWVVFALPNVIGAAAMGWVLLRPGSSEKMVASHAPAMTAFSVVTILFHVLFVGWVVRWLGGWAFVGAAAGFAIVAFPLLLSRTSALVLSGLTLIGSITAFIVAFTHTTELPIPAGRESVDLFYLAPVCIIGFALCPYLDLTFHRARQAVSSYGSVAAFTLGFGGMFLAMILFTLWYGPMALPPDAVRAGMKTQTLTQVAALAVVAHMAGQAGFTVAAHSVEVVRRLRQQGVAGGFSDRAGLLAGIVFAGPIFAIVAWFHRTGGYQGLGANEIGYRLFMSFYGLVAPAYCCLFLIPFRHAKPKEPVKWIGFVATLALAGVCYWIGFVEQHMVWLVPGVLIIPASRVIVARWARPAKS